MPIWGPFALIFLGIAAVWLELFVPAFGLVALAGIATIVVAVVQAYRTLPAEWAFAVLVTALVVPPAAIIVLLRRFSGSRFGKRLILDTTLAQADPVARTGASGTAETALHPSGYARVEDKRINVVTRGEYVAAGTPVVVIAQEGARVVVRASGGSNEI